MRKILLLVTLICGLSAWANGDHPGGGLTDGQVIRLYQGKAPGSEDWTHHEVTLTNTSNPITFNVTEPTMKVFLPEKPNGTAMIVCPGGGFCMLSIRTEGELAARQLAKQGITAFVLTYRTCPMLMKDGRAPKDAREFMEVYMPLTEVCKQNFKDKHNGQEPTVTEWCGEVPYQEMAFADANQAMKTVRQHAGEWNLRADKIGIMGFSAGAITSMHQTLFNTPETQPDFTGIIYGGWTADIKVPAGAGPVWICSPVNDIFHAEEPENVYHAWREAKVPTELHTFWDCNHGFGASTTEKNVDNWMALMVGFMRDVKFLPQTSASPVRKETYAFRDTFKVDIYWNPSARVTGRRPVFLHVHGGGWGGGDRTIDVDSAGVFGKMVDAGMIVASMDYPLGIAIARSQGKLDHVPMFGKSADVWNDKVYSDIIRDAIRTSVEYLYDATGFLVAHADQWNADVTKIIIGGGSAGAINSVMAENWLSNETELAAQHLPKDFRYAGVIGGACAIMLSMDDSLTWKNRPCPVMMYHGDADDQVPFDEIVLPKGGYKFVGSKQIAKSLRAMKVPYMLCVGQQYDHVMSNIPFETCGEEMLSFINRLVVNQEKVAVETIEEDYEGPRTLMKYFSKRMGLSPEAVLKYVKDKNQGAP